MKKIKERINLISPLNEQEQRAMVATGDVKLFKLYLSKKNLSLELSEDAQVDLVRSGNLELVLAYKEEFCFCAEAQREIAKSGNIDMIRAGNIFELIKAGNIAFLTEYLPGTILHEQGEFALVRSQNVELLKCYLKGFNKYFTLYGSVQIELVRMGNTEMLKAYLANNDFEEAGQREIIKSGNIEIFKIYIARHHFYMDVEAELFKTHNIEWIELYFNKYHCSSPAENELLKLGDADLIDRYEKRWNVKRNRRIGCFFGPNDNIDI